MSTSPSIRLPGEPFYIARAAPARRVWVHVLLLALTFFSTTVVGAGLQIAFAAGRTPRFEDQYEIYVHLFSSPGVLLLGLPFSLTLLTILLAHEMGHYLACRHYGIDATLPYFLPAPTLIGTFGAFIRIKSPIYSRRQLFDVGVAGPIAGFVTLLPVLAIGIGLSHVQRGIGDQGEFVFGTPLLLRFAELLAFPRVEAADIALHPLARAAWFGLLATALNLLPIGQLDGGHILYAIAGAWHKPLSRFFALVLAVIAPFTWWTWLGWAGVLFFFGMRHPTICDDSPLGLTRGRLAIAAVVMLVLSFTLVPVRAGF
ncbi:MAG TPA: site-2 protease family protein [Bryobacteraceae bacterium]|nr:site-2 protease family protein [Bryobacteraceae bacterium]